MFRRLFNRFFCWVNLYEVDREYGGPEEGGWWYDYGVPVKSRLVLNRHKTRAVVEMKQLAGTMKEEGERSRFSMVGTPDFEVYVENHKGRAFPSKTPHYE